MLITTQPSRKRRFSAPLRSRRPCFKLVCAPLPGVVTRRSPRKIGLAGPGDPNTRMPQRTGTKSWLTWGRNTAHQNETRDACIPRRQPLKIYCKLCSTPLCKDHIQSTKPKTQYLMWTCYVRYTHTHTHTQLATGPRGIPDRCNNNCVVTTTRISPTIRIPRQVCLILLYGTAGEPNWGTPLESRLELMAPMNCSQPSNKYTTKDTCKS